MAGREAYFHLVKSETDQAIESGNAFNAVAEFTVLGESAIYIQGVTVSEIEMFKRSIDIVTDGTLGIDAKISLWEDSTSATIGENVDSKNENRNSLKESTFNVFLSPDLPVLGNELEASRTKIRTEKQSFQFSASKESRYIMKENTKYIVLVENFKTYPIDVELLWNWIERGV